MAWYDDIVDSITGDNDWLDLGTSLYNLYDDNKNSGQSSSFIQASDPWLAANQQAAGELVNLRADGGAAYMQTPGAQAQLDVGNKAYYRAQQGGGDRLSTGAAERRETQATSLYTQIINARDAQLRGVPGNNPETGVNLSSIDRQSSLDQGYNWESVRESLGNIFSGGGNTESSYTYSGSGFNSWYGDEHY